MRETRKHRAGFTLVELLVVIAIIAILIALLLPLAMKVHRRALVLVSPVAFQNLDDGQPRSLHLTDLRCGNDLQLISYPSPFIIFAPQWSPSGNKIGYQVLDSSCKEISRLCILTPMTGEIRTHPALCSDTNREWLFGGWIDDDQFIENAYPMVYIRSCKTGAVIRSLTVDGDNIPEGPYVWTGLGWNQRYIAISPTGTYQAGTDEGLLRFVRGDLTVGNTIWRPAPFMDGTLQPWRVELPSVDPLSESIMFPAHVTQRPSKGSPGYIILKSRDGHTPMYPLGGGMGTPNFLDDGNILNSGINIFKRNGELVRAGTIPTAQNVALRRYWRNAP